MYSISVSRLLPWLLLALTCALASCRPDGIDGEVGMAYTDIMTYEGPEGTGSLLTFRKVDDSPLVSITACAALDCDPGTRLLVSYTPQSGLPYTSGKATLHGAVRINQGAVATEWRQEYARWDSTPVYLYSIWRSGTYLNMRVRLPYCEQARIFGPVAEPSSAGTDTPVIYLAQILPEGAVTTFERDYYASFDLSPLWDRPDVKAVKVMVANDNLDKHIFTFSKQ